MRLWRAKRMRIKRGSSEIKGRIKVEEEEETGKL